MMASSAYVLKDQGQELGKRYGPLECVVCVLCKITGKIIDFFQIKY